MARRYKYQINSKRGIIKAVERPAGTTPIRESRGAYDPKATYSKGDTVIYNGLYYTATTGQGVPGEGDGWEISGIVSAKAVTLSIRLDKSTIDLGDSVQSVTATAKAMLNGQEITLGLPSDGWRWTWRGKEVPGRVSLTIRDLPKSVGIYPITVTHSLFGHRAESHIEVVDVIARIPTVWEVVPANVVEGAPLKVCREANGEPARRVTLIPRILRNGIDVTDHLADTPPHYTWHRRHPDWITADDDGITDAQWDKAHEGMTLITLSDKDIRSIATITVECSSDELNRLYNKK